MQAPYQVVGCRLLTIRDQVPIKAPSWVSPNLHRGPRTRTRTSILRSFLPIKTPSRREVVLLLQLNNNAVLQPILELKIHYITPEIHSTQALHP